MEPKVELGIVPTDGNGQTASRSSLSDERCYAFRMEIRVAAVVFFGLSVLVNAILVFARLNWVVHAMIVMVLLGIAALLFVYILVAIARSSNSNDSIGRGPYYGFLFALLFLSTLSSGRWAGDVGRIEFVESVFYCEALGDAIEEYREVHGTYPTPLEELEIDLPVPDRLKSRKTLMILPDREGLLLRMDLGPLMIYYYNTKTRSWTHS